MRTENIVGGIILFIVLFAILYWSFYVLKIKFITDEKNRKKVVIFKNLLYSALISAVFSGVIVFISDKLDDVSSGKKSRLMI